MKDNFYLYITLCVAVVTALFIFLILNYKENNSVVYMDNGTFKAVCIERHDGECVLWQVIR